MLLRRLGFLLLGVNLAVITASATTITETNGGSGDFFGQSFVTPSGGPCDDIAFNLFSGFGANAPPAAFGTGYLLSAEYLGKPSGLSSSVAGFLVSAVASSGFYSFAPSVTLQSNTTYDFYEMRLLLPVTLPGEIWCPE